MYKCQCDSFDTWSTVGVMLHCTWMSTTELVAVLLQNSLPKLANLLGEHFFHLNGSV